VLMNFARGGLVDNQALLDALGKQLKAYITDFPEEQLLGVDGVIAIPHLGASTGESENNCATMAARQLRDFLENGNIKNSVNFPECAMPRTTKTRLVFANANIPNMIGQIATFLAKHMINITDMINKSKGQIAYNIIDVDGDIDDQDIQTLRETEGVIMVRVIRD
jgi:D-3-phosphoglycerate dehydrogenase